MKIIINGHFLTLKFHVIRSLKQETATVSSICKPNDIEILHHHSMNRIFKPYRYFQSYYASNPTRMKNEPVGSYNHMQEDEHSLNGANESVPASLYMLLIVDAVLISALAVFAAQIIF